MLKFVDSEGWECGESSINFLCRKSREDGEYDLEYKKVLYAKPFDSRTRLDKKALSVETIALPHQDKLKLKKSHLNKVFSLEVQNVKDEKMLPPEFIIQTDSSILLTQLFSENGTNEEEII